jgi:hypothetical protein
MRCDKGSEAGIGKHWFAKFVVKGRELADATLICFDKKTSVIKVNVTFDQVPKEITCRFFPPAVLPG